MARRYPAIRSALSSPARAEDCGRRAKPAAVKLDAFIWDDYLPHIRLDKRSWRVDERIARQYLSAAFGARRLADIQRHEVENWLRGLSSGGLCAATCNRILAVFKAICSLAEIRGVLPVGQSPCTGVSSFKIHAQRERYLTRDEAWRLMRALEKKRPRGSPCSPSASAHRRAQERSPQGSMGTYPPGFAAAYRAAVQVGQAAPYSAVRRSHTDYPRHSARARLSVAVSGACAGKTVIRYIPLLERSAAGAGHCRRAHP